MIVRVDVDESDAVLLLKENDIIGINGKHLSILEGNQLGFLHPFSYGKKEIS